MDQTELELALEWLTAVAKLVPVVAEGLPAIQNVFNNTTTEADLEALRTQRDAINAQVEAAEDKVIAQGNTDPSA